MRKGWFGWAYVHTVHFEAKWHSDKDKLCTMIGVVGTSFARARALLFHAWD